MLRMSHPLNKTHIITALLIFNLLIPFASAHARSSGPIKIVALGDSLTAGYGLPRSAAFPVQLQKRLKKLGYNVRIINAGISGDTASGGLARLDWAVPKGTKAVILELGANDALRGVSPGKTRQSLEKIVARLKKRGIEVLITGMIAPGGLGNEFGNAFNAIYGDLAQKYDTLHYPFFLDGVALDPRLNQSDGIHPNAKGVKVIAEKIEPYVVELIERVTKSRQDAASN